MTKLGNCLNVQKKVAETKYQPFGDWDFKKMCPGCRAFWHAHMAKLALEELVHADEVYKAEQIAAANREEELRKQEAEEAARRTAAIQRARASQRDLSKVDSGS